MLKWLGSLHLHHFGDVKGESDWVKHKKTGVMGALNRLKDEKEGIEKEEVN